MKMNRFTSQYRTSEELREMPHRSELIVVEAVRTEEVGGVEKPVLYGEADGQVYVLNPTNIDNLITIFGTPESDDWVGLMVVAYHDPSVMFNNKRRGGIRFRKPKPGTPRPETPTTPRVTRATTEPSTTDDIPF